MPERPPSPPIEVDPAVLTAFQVSKLLCLGTKTVRRLSRKGHLPAPILVGGSIRWRRSDLDAWLAEQPGYRAETVDGDTADAGATDAR